MARQPTPKQKEFVKEFLKTGNRRRSAAKVYDVKRIESADRIAYDNMRNPRVQNYMAKILDGAGLTDEHISEALKKIVEAGISRSSLRKAKPDDALRAIEQTAKLKDLYPAEKKEISTRNMTLKLQGKSPEELLEALAKLQTEIQVFSKLAKGEVNGQEVEEIPQVATE